MLVSKAGDANAASCARGQRGADRTVSDTRRLSDQAALLRYVDRLCRAEKIDGACEAAADATIDTLACSRSAVLLREETGAEQYSTSRGLSDDCRVELDKIASWEEGAPDPRSVFIDNVDASASLPPKAKRLLRAAGISSLALVPIVANGRLTGRLGAFFDSPGRQSEVSLAVLIARQLGLAIERLRAAEFAHALQRQLRAVEERFAVALAADGTRAKEVPLRGPAERGREWLVAELSHRVKNALAVVLSLSRHTFSAAPNRDAADRFEARVMAMSRTHRRLADVDWAGASLEAILRDETALHALGDGSNITIAGPPVVLRSKAALVLGMAFHELTANAAAHGALSLPGGSVEVSWAIDEESNRISIRWSERGGPPVENPTRRGFGRLLLEHGIMHDLAGVVRLDFASGGLTCLIDIPLTENVMASPFDRSDGGPAA